MKNENGNIDDIAGWDSADALIMDTPKEPTFKDFKLMKELEDAGVPRGTHYKVIQILLVDGKFIRKVGNKFYDKNGEIPPSMIINKRK